MKRIKSALNYIRVVGLLILILVAIVSVVPYLLCPVYDFDEPMKFTGDDIYNPYSNMEGYNWLKANLHSHTVASDGINTLKEVESEYKRYEYQVLAITDHSVVVDRNVSPPHQVHAYEHGINLGMFHSVVLGAEKGSKFDFPFFSFLSHKHYILKMLENKGDIQIIAHPQRIRFFNSDNAKYLSGYQMTEIYPTSDGRLTWYDAALSAGYYSTVSAGDDSHNVFSTDKIGVAATFINAEGTDYESIRKALEAGHNFAVTVPRFKDPEYKLSRNMNLPVLNDLTVNGDSVEVSFSEEADIIAIGHEGSVRAATKNTSLLKTVFTSEDTYLRFVAKFDDGVMLYTNPLIRTNNNIIINHDLASVNYPLSLVQTLFLSTIIVMLFRYFFITLIDLLPSGILVWGARYRIFINRTRRGKLKPQNG